ncbi:hypothetical protein [Streptomyces sp. NPDC005181]|uniref:hypothetical protein n=1 Tax=Streptomyces sp. NPDC005181 TaxID=3156869 RepID=UPI0033BB6BEB
MRTHTALAAAAITLLALTGCNSDTKADPAACKAAMAKAFDDAIAAGNEAKKSKSPAACDGVDNKTLQRIAGELISDRAGKPAEDAVTPPPGKRGGFSLCLVGVAMGQPGP